MTFTNYTKFELEFIDLIDDKYTVGEINEEQYHLYHNFILTQLAMKLAARVRLNSLIQIRGLDYAFKNFHKKVISQG